LLHHQRNQLHFMNLKRKLNSVGFLRKPHASTQCPGCLTYMEGLQFTSASQKWHFPTKVWHFLWQCSQRTENSTCCNLVSMQFTTKQFPISASVPQQEIVGHNITHVITTNLLRLSIPEAVFRNELQSVWLTQHAIKIKAAWLNYDSWTWWGADHVKHIFHMHQIFPNFASIIKLQNKMPTKIQFVHQRPDKNWKKCEIKISEVSTFQNLKITTHP